MAFGPHGPRAPTSQPGDNLKIFLSTVGLIGVGAVVFYSIHAYSSSLCSILQVPRPIPSSDSFHSPNYDQGMARSLKRTCEGDEAQSYLRSVVFSVIDALCDAH